MQSEAYEHLNGCSCPALNGKPKLFFVQACRGSKHGRYVGAVRDDGLSTSQYQLSCESDFFISYSTAVKTKSFRYDPPDTSTVENIDCVDSTGYKPGSFYITELCESLDTYAPCLDLQSIILTVHQTLQALMEPFEVELRDGTIVKTRQCPHLSSSLRGAVFFYSDAEQLYKKHVTTCVGKRHQVNYKQ